MSRTIEYPASKFDVKVMSTKVWTAKWCATMKKH